MQKILFISKNGAVNANKRAEEEKIFKKTVKITCALEKLQKNFSVCRSYDEWRESGVTRSS